MGAPENSFIYFPYPFYSIATSYFHDGFCRTVSLSFKARPRYAMKCWLRSLEGAFKHRLFTRTQEARTDEIPILQEIRMKLMRLSNKMNLLESTMVMKILKRIISPNCRKRFSERRIRARSESNCNEIC